MTDEQTKDQRGLQPADVALMRAIVMWRREGSHIGTPRAEFSTNRGWGGLLSWREGYPVEPKNRRVVAVEIAFHGDEAHPRQLRLCVSRPKMIADTITIEPRSLTEGVDLLVAFGFLPARFSSAYRAGWDDAHDCYPAPGSPSWGAGPGEGR